jgi:nicotinamidase-related amidase
MALPKNAALIVIDVQKAIDHPGWGRRNNLHAESMIARLLDAWRRTGRPVFHIRHMSAEPGSAYRPGQAGNEFKPQVLPLPSERVIEKKTNSAFINTQLEAELHSAGITTLVITGVLTNNSVEATARMAGNLGFDTYVVHDATAACDKADFNGILRSAEDVHAMSLANLDREYASVIGTEEILAMT